MEINRLTGASLGFGKTLLSASYNLFLTSILTSVFNPQSPLLQALEPEPTPTRIENETRDPEKGKSFLKIRKRKSTFVRLFTAPLQLFPLFDQDNMSVIRDSFSFILLNYFCYILFWNSDDQPLPLLEHDELDLLLNRTDWDQPLSPLDINLPTDPDIITFLSSSSPISPVVLPNQPPSPSVYKILQSLTNTPIQFTDHPATSRQESRVNIFLPSLCGSNAKTQSEESHSNPSLSRRLRSNSIALGTSTQDATESLSRPNQLQRKQQISKQKRRESRYWRCKFVRRPRYPSLHYQLTNAFFFLGKLYFGIIKDRSIPFKTLFCHHRDLWYPCQLLNYSLSNDTESSCTYI